MCNELNSLTSRHKITLGWVDMPLKSIDLAEQFFWVLGCEPGGAVMKKIYFIYFLLLKIFFRNLFLLTLGIKKSSSSLNENKNFKNSCHLTLLNNIFTFFFSFLLLSFVNYLHSSIFLEIFFIFLDKELL